jgi:hypothetical protein
LRKVDLQKLELVTARLGDTVVDPKLWPDVLEDICQAVGATGALLLQSDVRTPDVPRTKSVEELCKAYFSGWHLNDPRAQRAVPLLLSGTKIVVDQDIFTPEEISRSPFFNELCFPGGFPWFSAVGFWAGSALWGLCFQRSADDGPLEDDRRQILARLSQRLTEVSTLSTAVGRLALSSVTNALNCMLQPALGIDRNGRVLDVNRRANDLFDDDIRVHNRRLVVRDSFARTLLDQLINRLRIISDLDECPLNSIAIRRDGKHPVVLRAFPIHGGAREPFLGARALSLHRHFPSLLRRRGSPSLSRKARHLNTRLKCLEYRARRHAINSRPYSQRPERTGRANWLRSYRGYRPESSPLDAHLQDRSGGRAGLPG